MRKKLLGNYEIKKKSLIIYSNIGLFILINT